MILGVLSDNHGRLEHIPAVLRIFQSNAVEGIVHCGDLGKVETLEMLAILPTWFVWGNTDTSILSWRPLAESLGIHWPTDAPVLIQDGATKIAVFHGHESNYCKISTSDQYPYLLHGHTHQPADRQVGNTRIINPGALHRSPFKTVAILDTQLDRVIHFDVENGQIFKLS